jgi:hypothetical protein
MHLQGRGGAALRAAENGSSGNSSGNSSRSGSGNSTRPLCACPLLLMPVCGGDNVTYANACVAKCRGVNATRMGSCEPNGAPPDPAPAAQPCICPAIYQPVCAAGGAT